MSIQDILNRIDKDGIPKKVVDIIYLEWKTLFFRTRSATIEIFREMLTKLIPGIDPEHAACLKLQKNAMANFNNYRHRFNNAIEELAYNFIDAQNR
jgi:hypothetical protein